ncbi:ATP-binding protein [Streptomyces zagrosensis]|uniref:Anti-sigma regulatory factor (Ser/Thr protein kinase) n=1 Tax=Streptomyces zagrosensis TaxID=1042984 RepID=A0A7W9QK20_9ACTN|nr:ATP-binding protein [Streptomyces zagrosensis]MBB5940432.1 anti-sigma regulatory factor (Ser/Thr protein kinase) [Streptomyces zagrosensis]
MTDHDLVVAPPAPAPPGTPVVIYACLPPDSGRWLESPVDTGRVLESVRRYVHEREWLAIREFVDRARSNGVPAWERPELRQALAAVEAGGVCGIVTPTLSMLAAGAEETAVLARWQHGAGGQSFISAPQCMAVLRPHQRTVPAQLAVVGEVRAWVAECLRPLTPSDAVRDDALLCVDELIANAIVHAVPAAASPVGAKLTVTVHATQARVCIAVDDPAPDLLLPDPAAAGPDGALNEHGRGLGLIAALSERWGYERRAGEKRVWCTFALGAYGEAA